MGVFEITENGKLSAAKVTFGAEPKDGEVFEFILKHYYELKFSPAVDTKTKRTADNPKRRQITKEQREAEKQRQFEFRQQKRREKHKGH